MNDITKKRMNVLKIAGFSLYFVLLFVERLLALILSSTHGDAYALSAGNGFNYFAYAVTALSLAAGTVLFVRLFLSLGRSIRAGQAVDFDDRAKEWSIAAAVLLFGGMMHTGFTLPGLQFAAYGFLIGAMIVKCVEVCLSAQDKFVPIVSTLYLTLFSMSIPVCYLSEMSDPSRILFFIAESGAVFTLVPAFGYLLYRQMKEGVTSFSPAFPLVMCVLSGTTIALQWREKINYFVLIFAVLTVICYLSVGLIAFRRLRKPREIASDLLIDSTR